MRTYGRAVLEPAFGSTRMEWAITAAPQVLLRLKRVFERVAKTGRRAGVVYLAHTPENCRELEWFVQRYPLAFTEGDAAMLDANARDFDRRLETVGRITSEGYVPRAFDLQVPLRDYQRVGTELVVTNRRALIVDDLGLGKTALSIGVMADRDALPALVVTYDHLTRQWAAELQKFLPLLRVHALTKGTPYDLTVRRGRSIPFPDVIVTNYHKLAGWADTLAGQVRYVIFDECQELRTGDNSQKGRAARLISEQAEYACGLSATPIYNYGAEIYACLNVVAPGELGEEGEFRREWCGFDGKIAEPRALGTYLRERGLMLRRTRAEVGRELPPVQRIAHEIDADRAPLEDVRSSAVDLARLICDKTTTRTERFTAAGEFDYKLRRATGLAKAPHVADFVRLLCESEERVVLYGWHHDVYDVWRERLSDLNPVFFTGQESSAQKDAAREAFMSGTARVLIMSLRAGAGLDGLQGVARVVVFGELDWSPGVHSQCIGRLHRDGQTGSVSAYFLHCESGSDPMVVDVLGLKVQESEAIVSPDAPLVEAMEQTTGRVARLAREYLDAYEPRKDVARAS